MHATPDTALLAAEENLVTHMSWVQRRVPGMRVESDAALTIVDSGLPCDTFNFVCRARLAQNELEERIARVSSYFRSVSRPFSWWVGPADAPATLGDALTAAGYSAAESELAMQADLASLSTDAAVPPELSIVRVDSIGRLRDYARVNAANWTPPDENVIRFYDHAAGLLLQTDSPIELYVGYVAGEAVATAEMTIGGGVVGLYGIATLAEHRRRGYGTAMTLHPLRVAQARGFRTAILQASAEGAGIYARVGFHTTGSYTEYQP